MSDLRIDPVRAGEIQAGDILAASAALGGVPHACLVTAVERPADDLAERVKIRILDSAIFEFSNGHVGETTLDYDLLDVVGRVVPA